MDACMLACDIPVCAACACALRVVMGWGARSVLRTPSSETPSSNDMHPGALWEWLAELGVQRSSFHPHFGKPNEALHKVEAARYIIRKKVTPPKGGAPALMYEWGECAYEEVQQAGVKAFIAAVLQ